MARCDGRLTQAAALLVRLLGNVGGLVVADVGVECGHQHQRTVHQLGDTRAVGLDAHGAVVVEAHHTVGQQTHTLQEVVRHHGAEDIQFEVARGTAEVDGHVVAKHLRRQHRHGFALRGVDLAGHDGRAGFVLRNAEFTNAAARAAGEPAHVVGDLHHAGGQRLQGAMGVYQRIAASQRFKLIGGRHKRQAGKARQLCRCGVRVTLGGVQAGAHRRAAQRKFTQMR